ncbi:MAG: hypothetical protein U5K51_15370 [Flavobacteriaceae bacterium]|nr:hypothetical protein [Flavobacteriaceae bacterium]
MTSVLIIIVAIIVVALLAVLIVNVIPHKIKPLLSVVLWALIIFLGYKVYSSIMAPIKFNQTKQERYAKVIENLKMIRDAEIAYAEVNRKFTNDKAGLISFIDNAQFAITNVKNVVVTEKRGAITVDVEKRVVDTIGFKPVKEVFAGKNYKEMFNIPGTDKQFDIQVGEVEKAQGVKTPVFEVKVDKAVVLEGLDKDMIRQEKGAIGRYKHSR